MGHVDFFGIAPVLFILNYYKVLLFYRELNFDRELNSLYRGPKIIIQYESWPYLCRNSGNSVHNIAAVLTPVTLTVSTWQPRSTSYDRKQTANVGKNGYKVPQLLYLTRQNRPQSYPNTATLAEQITIRGLGLNTTNHDMRPIGLKNKKFQMFTVYSNALSSWVLHTMNLHQ